MALIPPHFLDCVVTIGVNDDKGERQWVASGFLYGHFLREVDDQTARYRVYLVTNRHVLEGRKIVYVRFNPKEAKPAREYSLDFERIGTHVEYRTHPDADIDLAILRINPNVLAEQGIQFSFFHSNRDVADKKTMEDLGLTEGDFGYVLGFPMAIVGEHRNFVIARHATIARIRDYMAEASKEVLVDCMIFPGNSGGPVVTKPEAIAISSTKAQNAAYLIGVVAGYIPYTDVAISQQTGRPRIIFEDNSGLASVVPVQYLIDLIQSLQPSPDTETVEIREAEQTGKEKD